MKQKFVDDLENTLARVPQADILILLRDFNARVSNRDVTSNLWQGSLGIHGLDKRNDAWKEFLEFCVLNQLMVWKEGNTSWHMDAPRDITWMISCNACQPTYILLQVMWGAVCWSDHQMVQCQWEYANQNQERRQSYPICNLPSTQPNSKGFVQGSSNSNYRKYHTILRCLQGTFWKVHYITPAKQASYRSSKLHTK